MKLVTGRELLASGLLQGGDHFHSPPRSLPVHVVCLTVLGVEGGLVTTRDVLDQTGDKLLGQVHDIVYIGVGPVELASGELGVVGKVNALIAELAAQFVHTLEAADNKHFQVQLGGNTHEQIHVQVIMMGDERLGGSTTGDGVHHRSFDLSEVTAVEEVAHVADNLGASTEDVARAVVHNQVEVALTESLLLVLETIVLGGDRMQARRQKDDLGGEDGEFTVRAILGVRTTREPDDTNNVTSPKLLMLIFKWHITGSKLSLADHLDLDTLCADVVENQLGAGRTLGVDATGNTDRNVGLLLTLLKAFIVLEELAQVGVDLELVWVGVRLLGLAQLVDALAPDLEILLERTQVSRAVHKTVDSCFTHVRSQVCFFLLRRSLLGGLGRRGSFLFLLLRLLLTELLASLQFGLGYLLASDLVKQEVGHGGLGLLHRVGIRHNVWL